ncbi:tyrosine-type recombinase/integrase [Varibaculum cambriense]|uniref:tyrosine-type recombinase/integrase n=1 Tax=Varibaculum cambriense TaxID=184870 RepID=UPI0003B77821|nr:tyrosine-type recombinase/integrase [Varibaculum cambriense]
MLELEPVPAGWEPELQDFIKFLVSEGRPATTRDLRFRWVRRFARWVDMPPWQVDLGAAVAWSAAHDWAPNTRRSAHQAVKAFYSWAVLAGRIQVSPVADLPAGKKFKAIKRPATLAEVEQAQAVACERVGLMIRLASEAGLRRGEVARVHARDITADLLGASLIVHGKGGKDRQVPISDSLAAAIRGAARGGYLFPGADAGHLAPATVGALVSRVLPVGVSMHDLRRGFATRAYQATGDLLSVQELLGHASPETTLAYVTVAPARLRAAVMAAA